MNTHTWQAAANDDRGFPQTPQIEILLIDSDGNSRTREEFLNLFAASEECSAHLKQLLMAPISLISGLKQELIDVLSACYFEPPIAIHSAFPKVVADGAVQELTRDVISYNPLLNSVDLAVMYEVDDDSYQYLSVDEFSHNVCFAISQFLLINNISPRGPNAIASEKRNIFNFSARLSHRNYLFLKNLETCFYHDTKSNPASYYRRFFPEIYPLTDTINMKIPILISNASHLLATLMYADDSYKKKYKFFFPRSMELAETFIDHFSEGYFNQRRVKILMGGEFVKEIPETSTTYTTHLKLV